MDLGCGFALAICGEGGGACADRRSAFGFGRRGSLGGEGVRCDRVGFELAKGSPERCRVLAGVQSVGESLASGREAVGAHRRPPARRAGMTSRADTMDEDIFLRAR